MLAHLYKGWVSVCVHIVCGVGACVCAHLHDNRCVCACTPMCSYIKHLWSVSLAPNFEKQNYLQASQWEGNGRADLVTHSNHLSALAKFLLTE